MYELISFPLNLNAMERCVDTRHTACVHENNVFAAGDFAFFDHFKKTGKTFSGVARVQNYSLLFCHVVHCLADLSARIVVSASFIFLGYIQ